MSATFRGGYLRLFGQYIERLPIPTVDVTKRKVDVQTAVSHYTNRNHTALLDEVGTDPILLHDMLAFLAEKMTTMHQERAQQVERFWDDLEGVVLDGKTFETLRTKGKWEQTVHKKIPSAQSFVDPESRSSITLDLSLGWNETAFKGLVKLIAGRVKGLSDIVNVYRDYAPTYTDLSQQIKETDALIDQLVYRLYSLTSEEIKLVESA